LLAVSAASSARTRSMTPAYPRSGLPKQTNARIPGAVVAVQQPAVIGRVRQQYPGRTPWSLQADKGCIERDLAFSRHDLPELCQSSRPLQNRGRRECRMQAAPMARLQQSKQAAGTTGKAGATGIPCTMAYGLSRALLGVRALIATVAPRNVSQNLIPASGDQDHTLSPSEGCITRRTMLPSSIASRANVRDDRETPL
jgi:hypothetical protein